MARIVTMVLRISWASHVNNASLAIASQVFVSAGILLLFLINLFFAQRIFRARQPKIGWNPVLSKFFLFLYFSLVATLIIVITAAVQSFYTLDRSIRMKDRDMQRFGSTYLLFIAFLPLPLIVAAVALPRRGAAPLDNFGTGSFRTKIAIVMASASLLLVGAGFRCANAYRNPVPLGVPTPWYLSRAAFYNFNFTIEIIVAYFWAIVRIDRRFWIPNGARGPGSYGNQTGQETRDQTRGQDAEAGSDHMDLGKKETLGDDSPVNGGNGASKL